MYCRAVLWCACLSLATGTLLADEAPGAVKRADVFDIIPAEAQAAVAIRNVADLIKRGDTLLEKTKLKVPFRLSEGYEFVLATLEIKAGVDPEGAAALMSVQVDADVIDVLGNLVLAVPVADFAVMADGLKIPRADLVEGKVIDRQVGGFKPPGYVRYAAVRGRHVLLGVSEKHVAAAAKGKSLREVLTPEELATFPEDASWSTSVAA